VDACARAIIDLLRDRPRARALGASGRERMRRHFLIPRLVLDALSLMRRLAAGAQPGRALESVSQRDPVCGMTIQTAAVTAAIEGLTLKFCSEQCRDSFAADAERYVRLARPIQTSAGAQPGAP